jgi:hypothetical protein
MPSAHPARITPMGAAAPLASRWSGCPDFPALRHALIRVLVRQAAGRRSPAALALDWQGVLASRASVGASVAVVMASRLARAAHCSTLAGSASVRAAMAGWWRSLARQRRRVGPMPRRTAGRSCTGSRCSSSATAPRPSDRTEKQSAQARTHTRVLDGSLRPANIKRKPGSSHAIMATMASAVARNEPTRIIMLRNARASACPLSTQLSQICRMTRS